MTEENMNWEKNLHGRFHRIHHLRDNMEKRNVIRRKQNHDII